MKSLLARPFPIQAQSRQEDRAGAGRWQRKVWRAIEPRRAPFAWGRPIAPSLGVNPVWRRKASFQMSRNKIFFAGG